MLVPSAAIVKQFVQTSLHKLLARVGAALLGDSSSVISRNLMVLYHECGNDRERAYNVMFTRERVFIERLIGQWKRRFNILSHPIFA